MNLPAQSGVGKFEFYAAGAALIFLFSAAHHFSGRSNIS
jgi:hypothetical protein